MKIFLKAYVKPRKEDSPLGFETIVVRTLISHKVTAEDIEPLSIETFTAPSRTAEAICSLINQKP